jgi:hypothetical protein
MEIGKSGNREIGPEMMEESWNEEMQLISDVMEESWNGEMWFISADVSRPWNEEKLYVHDTSPDRGRILPNQGLFVVFWLS